MNSNLGYLRVRVSHLLVGAGIALAGLTGWVAGELTSPDVEPHRPVVHLDNLKGKWNGVVIDDGRELCLINWPCADAGVDE